MSNIKNWFCNIVNNELHAYNRVSNRDLSICFNFLQIPDTTTIVMTIAIMKNKVKKNSLNPTNFAKVMSCIESSIEEVYWQECSDKEKIPKECFVSTNKMIDNQWYVQLCCHRLFFIPEEMLFPTIKHLFTQENIRTLKNNDLKEVAVLVNTDQYDFNAKFY